MYNSAWYLVLGNTALMLNAPPCHEYCGVCQLYSACGYDPVYDHSPVYEAHTRYSAWTCMCLRMAILNPIAQKIIVYIASHVGP